MIPTLVMVETWQWTPLVMLIVLGGLASLPTDPYEAAVLDGASVWQVFRHITLPLVWPFIVVAAVIRGIDALKAFDTIFVISHGGPGTASETLNILLYLQAFGFYDIGYASAIVVVFFVLILLVTLLLLHFRAARRANCMSLMSMRRPRHGGRMRRILGRIGLYALGARAGLAGAAGVPVDAVAVAEERGRQHRLPAGLHSRTRRRSPTSSTCSRRTTSSPTPGTRWSCRSAPPGSRCWSACPPATASPRRGPPGRRC